LGSSKGDLVITDYGLEGSPIYLKGKVGQAYLDLKPDLNQEALLQKMSKNPNKLSPLRLAQKNLNLNNATLALLYHQLSPDKLGTVETLIEAIKKFPIHLSRARPIEEAISSAGGVSLDEINDNLMLTQFPGVFLAGEMLDWDAPTGGFLIQACVSQGYVAAEGIKKYLVTSDQL
jgi:predicted flavoprotein YhiN